MPKFATYQLPEKFTGQARPAIESNESAFEKQLQYLKKMAFCQAILSLFKLVPALEQVSFEVEAYTTPLDRPPYWPVVQYRLEAFPNLGAKATEEDDSGVQLALQATVYETFNKDIAVFCEELEVSRAQLDQVANNPESLLLWLERF